MLLRGGNGLALPKDPQGSQQDPQDPSRTQGDPSRTDRIPAAPWDPSNYKTPLPCSWTLLPSHEEVGLVSPLISPSPAAP